MNSSYHIILTRSAADNLALQEQLQSKFSLALAPSLKFNILKIEDDRRIKIFSEFKNQKFDYLVFTSKNGVVYFKQLLQQLTDSTSLPVTCKLAAVGEKTAQICWQEFQRHPDIIAPQSNAKSLVAELLKSATPLRILLIKPEKSLLQVEQEFERLGERLTKLTCYQTIALIDSNYKKVLATDKKNIFVFFSPSAFNATLVSFGEVALRQGLILTIGQTTSDAIRGAGFSVWQQASTPSEKAVVEILDKL